jgi:hypothetical protein
VELAAPISIVRVQRRHSPTTIRQDHNYCSATSRGTPHSTYPGMAAAAKITANRIHHNLNSNTPISVFSDWWCMLQRLVVIVAAWCGASNNGETNCGDLEIDRNRPKLDKITGTAEGIYISVRAWRPHVEVSKLHAQRNRFANCKPHGQMKVLKQQSAHHGSHVVPS